MIRNAIKNVAGRTIKPAKKIAKRANAAKKIVARKEIQKKIVVKKKSNLRFE